MGRTHTICFVCMCSALSLTGLVLFGLLQVLVCREHVEQYKEIELAGKV